MSRAFASFLVAALLVAALSAPAATAHAQATRELSPAEVEEARALFVAGSAAVESGRWADAVTSFERAYELTGAPSALYNLALALRALGRHRDARDAFDRLLTAHSLEDDELRTSVAQMRGEEAARVAVLELVGLDPDARHAIRFDGRDVVDDGARPVDVETDAGTHTLIAEREGFAPFVWEGSLADGERRAVRAMFSPITQPSQGDDTALHVVLVVSAIAAIAAGGAILGYVLWEDAQVQPLYPQRVEP